MVRGVAPPLIPAPLPAWKKWALQLGATPSSFLVDLLDYLSPLSPAEAEDAGEWRHVQAVFVDTFSNRTADEMIVTFDIANITAGSIDSSWTSGDYDTVDAALSSLCNQWAAHMCSQVTAHELRYYRRSYNPYTTAKPFPDSGPPEHVFSMGYVGALDGQIPHQIAVTHTELTAWPRHWGRCYWPAPAYSAGTFGSGGLLAATFVDAWAAAIEDIYNTLAGDEFFPLVATTTVGGVVSRQLLGVQKVQVDDIADVQRRRRAWAGVHKATLPV